MRIHKGGMVMNSELLKSISESLIELKKRKKEVTKEMKAFRENADYLSRKGKARLSALNDELEEIEAELVKVQDDYDLYSDLCDQVEELKQLISVERKPKTKESLKKLYNEKLEVLAETEKYLDSYYAKALQEDKDEPVLEVDDKEEKKEKEDKNKAEKVEKPEKEVEGGKTNKSKKRNHKIRNIILACGGISLVFLSIGLVKGCGYNNNRNEQFGVYQQYEADSDDDLDLPSSDVPELIDDDEPEEELSIDEILQGNDAAGVVAKAEEVLEDLDYLDEIDHSFEGDELNTIVNIIRVSNGELPLDENNNEYYDPNVVDKYVQARTDIFANYPSSPQLDEIYSVNYADIVTDDENLQQFAEKYDEVYNAIAEARNENDWDAFAVNTQKLGEMMYSDWVLQGMYNGNNPYNFEADQRLLALGISTERYASYVMEYENGNRGTVCADVCTDYSTGDTKEIPVEDIYNAIVLGVCNDATLAVNAPSGYQIISEEFYKSLVNELDYKNQLSLKLN